MGLPSRHTRPVPYGQHVYVVSDLDLSPSTPPSNSGLTQFVDTLRDIDDAAVVVVAGNLFRPAADQDIVECVRLTLDRLPALAHALRSFCAMTGHALYVLPGSHDADLATSDEAQRLLEDAGVTIAHDLMVQVATSRGVKEMAIASGVATQDLSAADAADRGDAAALEDPAALASFVASRFLYRRLAPLLWTIFAAIVAFDLFNSISRLITHFTHGDIDVHAPHTHSFWGNLTVNLLLIVGLEALVVLSAGLIVRQRFERSVRRRGDGHSEPLASTFVDEVDALEYARRVMERGGAGAIVGGGPRPALAFLDQGVCATPGPTRDVMTEREGRFGLPPVFVRNPRFGMVVIEAASDLQVRLVGGEDPVLGVTGLERLAAGAEVQPGPPARRAIMGSWPSGNPFPLSLERLRDARRQRSVRRWASGLLLLDGLVNVMVAASPPLRSRLHLVLKFLPLGVAQSAAVVTAVAGVAMIMLARGVRRGQRRAWYLAVGVLSLTVVGHLLRGGSVASSAVAAVVLGLLIVQRRQFQASADRTSVRSALPRLLGIAVVTVAGAALSIEVTTLRIVHHHLAHHVTPHWPNFGQILLACAERLIGQSNVTLPDSVNDFANPVLVTIGVTLVVSALYVITRPVVDRRLSVQGSSAERRLAELRAREIVRRHGRGTLDYFALRDDKQFYFFRDSLVAYAVYGGVALVSPDPIGPEAERSEVFSSFRSFAENRGWTIAVMGAGADWLPIYSAAGFHYLYLGDEAIVDCQHFTLEGGKMKGLRQACTRLARHGYTVEFYDPATIDPKHVIAVMDLISMLRRGEDERGFSMMLGRLFDPKDKGLLLTIVRGPDGQPAAACQFVPSPAIGGYSLDLMRRDPGEHPNGLIDYALCSTIAHLKEQGAQGLSLNFSAFRSVLDGERGEGTWTRVERWTLKRLSGVLPIESLWQFNAKYQPTWLPRHIVYPALESFVPVVSAILRAESITEFPVIGRFLANDPSNRPGTVVPPDVLAAARALEKN